MKWCIFYSLTAGGIYGNYSAMGHVGALIHGYFFFKIDGHRTSGWRYVILKTFGQHVNEMMAVAVRKFLNF